MPAHIRGRRSRARGARAEDETAAQVDRSVRLVQGALETCARARRVLDAHDQLMRQAKGLVAQARARCAEPVEPLWPAVRQLRVVAPAPAAARTCMRLGCERTARFLPRVVLAFGARRLTLRGLPLRVCAEHGRDLEALSRTARFLRELASGVRRRGGDAPSAVRVELDPIR